MRRAGDPDEGRAWEPLLEPSSGLWARKVIVPALSSCAVSTNWSAGAPKRLSLRHFSPSSSLRKVRARPLAPLRAVRPTRWVSQSAVSGSS